MSVNASNPVATISQSMEIVRLSPKWQEGLLVFLQDLHASGDDVLFSPHASDEDTINRLVSFDTVDSYYLLVEKGIVLGYGLLRGWDEGYQIPSLGMAIHPSARRSGLGNMFMNFLHLVARRKGADKIRLRVFKENDRAIGLYKSLGYVFEDDGTQQDYLIGFRSLGN